MIVDSSCARRGRRRATCSSVTDDRFAWPYKPFRGGARGRASQETKRRRRGGVRPILGERNKTGNSPRDFRDTQRIGWSRKSRRETRFCREHKPRPRLAPPPERPPCPLALSPSRSV